MTVQVPEAHRAELLRVLLNLYAVKAEAFHHNATKYLMERGSVDPVLADQGELRAVHELIDQLGWRLDVPIHREAVTGDRYVLTEVARAVLENAVSRLSDGFGEAGSQPDKIVAVVAPAIRRVSSAFGLLRQTYHAPACGGARRARP